MLNGFSSTTVTERRIREVKSVQVCTDTSMAKSQAGNGSLNDTIGVGGPGPKSKRGFDRVEEKTLPSSVD